MTTLRGSSVGERSQSDAARDIARRADRIAFLYDLIDAPMSALGGRRRRGRLLARARGRVLEVGIGTGLNLDLYPANVEITGIDLSPKMLARARRRAARLGLNVALEEANVEALPFADSTFDTVVGTCVFCCVADPLRGLQELRRVVKPDGQVLLLEHVRPENPVMGRIADLVSPITRRLIGPELNRRTEETVVHSALRIVGLRRSGVWREIVAFRDVRGLPKG